VTPLVVLLALTAMGGSAPAAERAIESSPVTLYHFGDAAWWGRPVRISTRSLHVSHGRATAVVVASGGGATLARQPVTLVRSGGSWTVSSPAGGAPYGIISGPTAYRVPTVQEQTAISAAGSKELRGERDCVRFVVRVSTVDPAYAAASLTFFGPRKAQCESNGQLLFVHSPSGIWSYRGSGSDPFACSAAPPGVIRSLFGTCTILAD
jgi:hypothetical protein